ncbi:MAG: hypothetical protein P1U89_17965 [Verrucomicrobiales bacterium]|nr:hypothetical protein [Verrucomicrobiales bacterium]
MKRLIYQCLNRRSQRQSFGWTHFAKLWHEQWEMPKPLIVEQRRPHYGNDSEGNLIPSLID